MRCPNSPGSERTACQDGMVAKARNHSRVASALPHSEGIADKPPCGEVEDRAHDRPRTSQGKDRPDEPRVQHQPIGLPGADGHARIAGERAHLHHAGAHRRRRHPFARATQPRLLERAPFKTLNQRFSPKHRTSQPESTNFSRCPYVWPCWRPGNRTQNPAAPRAILVVVATNTVLFEKKADQLTAPASLAKLMAIKV